MRVTVTGAGGFIGSHLVARLVGEGHTVRGVDLVQPAFAPSAADEFRILDLTDPSASRAAVAGADLVFALAANMGGIGWTHAAPAQILRDNLLISTHTLDACREADVPRVVYTSSACVYPMRLQGRPDSPGLHEDTVWPADPDREYGWEKLTTEILAGTYRNAYGMDVRIARLHGIYGPGGEFDGPRSKSLHALCGKIARVDGAGEIEIWGDGTQTRSYCYVDDCVEGLLRLSARDVGVPVNIGAEERISISGLVDLIAAEAGVTVSHRYLPDRPVGPRGRASDNTRCRELLGWEPSTPLEEGVARTYAWVVAMLRGEAPSTAGESHA